MRLPITPSLYLFSLAPFLRNSACPLPMFRLEFWGEVNHEETRVMGLFSSEDPVIVACHFDMIPGCDGRTGPPLPGSAIPFLCRLGLRVGFLYRLGFRLRVSSAHFCIFWGSV